VNNGSVVIAPPAAAPGGLVSLEQVSDLRARPAQTWLLGLRDAIVAARATGQSAVRRFFFDIALLAIRVQCRLPKLGQTGADLHRERGLRSAPHVPVYGGTSGALPQRPDLASRRPTPHRLLPQEQAQVILIKAKAFRAASGNCFAAFQGHPVDAPANPPLQLESLQKSTLERIDPSVTVPQRIRSMISFQKIKWQPTDILASPFSPRQNSRSLCMLRCGTFRPRIFSPARTRYRRTP